MRLGVRSTGGLPAFDRRAELQAVNGLREEVISALKPTYVDAVFYGLRL